MIFALLHQLLLDDILDILHSHTGKLPVLNGSYDIINLLLGDLVLLFDFIIRFLYCMDDLISVVLSLPSVSLYYFHISYLTVFPEFARDFCSSSPATIPIIAEVIHNFYHIL